MPTWFRIAAIVLVLWDLMGCYACYSQIRLGAAAMGPVDDWSLKDYAALVLRDRRALPLLWISLAAIVVMFGYAFAATDLIAHKGLEQVLPFPLFIAAVGVFSVCLAGLAARNGWNRS